MQPTCLDCNVIRQYTSYKVLLRLFVTRTGNDHNVAVQTTSRASGSVSPSQTPAENPSTHVTPSLLGIAVTISSFVAVILILLLILLVICIRLKRNHVIILRGTLSIPPSIQDASLHYSIERRQNNTTSFETKPNEHEFMKTYPPLQKPPLVNLSRKLVRSMQQNPDYTGCVVSSDVHTHNNIIVTNVPADPASDSKASPDSSCEHLPTHLPHVFSKTGTLGPVFEAPAHTTCQDSCPLEVLPCNIRIIQALGEGTFGHVYLAETVGLTNKSLGLREEEQSQRPTHVAVKMLRENATADTQMAFEKECKFMSRLNHENVVRLLAVCREGQHFLLMEHMENGDLHTFLKRYGSITTHPYSNSSACIPQRTLLSMCVQIASAMKYLASKNYVHRDLATRNCLVGRNFVIKVSDFGMSRNLYDSSYYLLHGKAMLPVRWMAWECFSGRFSQKSDVWAFGVTMWEIFTLASVVPYETFGDMDLIQNAIKGASRQLLERPVMCPHSVFDVIKSCWRHDPAERGDFSELLTELGRL